MKTIAAALACLLVTPVLADESTAPEGVRGHHWGSSARELGATTVIETSGDSKCYARKNEDLTVAEARLDDVGYCYYQDRFYLALMHFKGLENFSGLKSTLFQKYGAGRQPNQYLENYLWFGDAFYLNLDYSQISHKGTITYAYPPIVSEKEKADAEKAKKGADKL